MLVHKTIIIFLKYLPSKYISRVPSWPYVWPAVAAAIEVLIGTCSLNKLGQIHMAICSCLSVALLTNTLHFNDFF